MDRGQQIQMLGRLEQAHHLQRGTREDASASRRTNIRAISLRVMVGQEPHDLKKHYETIVEVGELRADLRGKIDVIPPLDEGQVQKLRDTRDYLQRLLPRYVERVRHQKQPELKAEQRVKLRLYQKTLTAVEAELRAMGTPVN